MATQLRAKVWALARVANPNLTNCARAAWACVEAAASWPSSRSKPRSINSTVIG